MRFHSLAYYSDLAMSATINQKLVVLSKLLECNKKDFSKSLSNPDITVHVILTPKEITVLEEIAKEYRKIKAPGIRPAEKNDQSSLFIAQIPDNNLWVLAMKKGPKNPSLIIMS